MEEKEDLDNEQAALDDHNDRVAGLFDCLTHLATPEEGEEKPTPDPLLSLHRRLLHLEGNLPKIAEAVSAIADKAEVD